MFPIPCTVCGNLFEVEGRRIHVAKYCGYDCRDKAYRTGKNLECRCGKLFWASPSQIAKGRKFCSIKCTNDSKPKIGPIPCPQCGKDFKPKVFPGNRWRPIYCSRKCFNAHGITHGLSRHPAYRVWSAMMVRCYKEKATTFPNYGGRGITVCPEWHDPAVFIKWAESSGYGPNLEIDRRKNDLGYSPSNCRWVTSHISRCNTRIRTGGASKYRGVTVIEEGRKWAACVRHNYKTYWLGRFLDEEEAAKAYDKKAKELRGEYAVLNFPES
jgi:hypothetical protein